MGIPAQSDPNWFGYCSRSIAPAEEVANLGIKGHTSGRYKVRVDPQVAFLLQARAAGTEAEAASLNSLNRKGRRKLLSMLRKGNRHAR